ncbi:putative secreted protein [Streptomyces sp. Tu6071]|nr:putative secreted protein [Streptomyces sp. Tu6071]
MAARRAVPRDGLLLTTNVPPCRSTGTAPAAPRPALPDRPAGGPPGPSCRAVRDVSRLGVYGQPRSLVRGSRERSHEEVVSIPRASGDGPCAGASRGGARRGRGARIARGVPGEPGGVGCRGSGTARGVPGERDGVGSRLSPVACRLPRAGRSALRGARPRPVLRGQQRYEPVPARDLAPVGPRERGVDGPPRPLPPDVRGPRPAVLHRADGVRRHGREGVAPPYRHLVEPRAGRLGVGVAAPGGVAAQLVPRDGPAVLLHLHEQPVAPDRPRHGDGGGGPGPGTEAEEAAGEEQGGTGSTRTENGHEPSLGAGARHGGPVPHQGAQREGEGGGHAGGGGGRGCGGRWATGRGVCGGRGGGAWGRRGSRRAGGRPGKVVEGWKGRATAGGGLRGGRATPYGQRRSACVRPRERAPKALCPTRCRLVPWVPIGGSPHGCVIISTHPQALARRQVWLLEASPSPVYGAALLMRFGAYPPSRVQIPPPPQHPQGPARPQDVGALRRSRARERRRTTGGTGNAGPGARGTRDQGAPGNANRGSAAGPEIGRPPSSGRARDTDFASGRPSCNVVLARQPGDKNPGTEHKHS